MARLRHASAITLLCLLSAPAPRAMQAPAAQKPELVLPAQTTVNHLAFSPDGRLLASGGLSDNALHLWEVATGFQVRTLDASVGGGEYGQSGVTAIAFGPGNRYVAAGYFDGSAVVWEVA